MAHKKLLISLIIIILVAVFCVTLSGCETTGTDSVTVSSILVLTQHEGAYYLNEDGHIDDMDLSEITIKVIYSNGDEETVTVDSTMFSTEDINKFETKGDHTLFINYADTNVPLTISVRVTSEIEAYNALFYPLGGSNVESQYTDIITRFADPSRENYTFDGWYTNIDCTGNKVIAPYTLTADTTFYAKWIDNRRCSVTFYDEEEILYQFEVVYGTSIDPDDTVSYPEPSEKEGLVFTGWQVSQGQYYEITTDLVLSAQYEAMLCVATLQDCYSRYVDYGEWISVSGYDLPFEAGHQARWVVYVNDSEEFVEWGDSSLNFDGDNLQVNKSKIEIKPYQQINTYEIKVYNGLGTQTDANIKAGNILLEQVYNSSSSIFLKEYNTTFNLAITDGVNDVTATSYEGYNVEWCFITFDENNKEVWRNTSNLIWSDELNTFRVNVESGDVESRNFLLKDADGNVLARIKDGNITEIQGAITIKPKYIKKNYTIQLSRRNSYLPVTFTVPYYTDFALYDPDVTEYVDAYSTWNEVKDSYLQYTVASWLTADMSQAEDWQTAKWDIAWYSNPSSTLNEYKVEFEYNNATESYGYYTVKENTVLYARDIDNRTYDITIRYGYDFINNNYTKEIVYENYTQSQEINLPTDLGNSITYEGVTYSYTSMYDFPYEGSDTKYIGTPVTNYNSRTKNVVYYAHYVNNRTYDVYIYDKTQSEAYTDANSPYIVADGSMYYTLLSGAIFDSAMLYKGTTTTVSQTFYNAYVFYTNFNSVTVSAYDQLLTTYGGAGKDKATAIAAIQALIDQRQTIVDDYLNLLTVLSAYTYSSIDLGGLSYTEYYNKYLTGGSGCYDMNTTYGVYASAGSTVYTYTSNAYNTYREEIYDYQAMLDLINSYESDSIKAANYQNDWDFYPYSNSADNLNSIYAAGVTDYYFAGWYYDSYYTQKADDIATDSNNPMYFSTNISGNITLYAKWVDRKKGTEGLIFERIGANQVVVVDYLNYTQFSNTSYSGTAYSQNLNDQDSMPRDLGTEVTVQIPSEHRFILDGGTIEVCTVIGIVAGAFDTNGALIADIELPNTLRFVEEGVFNNCNLYTITYTTGTNDYLYIDSDRVLYQVLDYNAVDGVTLTSGIELGTYTGGNLIAYANKNTFFTTYTVPDTINSVAVTRIANYAFKGSGLLTSVTVGENVEEIGDYSFMGCNKLSVANLPNSLNTIGLSAFKDSSLLADINFVASTAYPESVLRYVKKDAFKNTAWLISKNGLVILANKIIDVQLSGDGDIYAKDEVSGEYLLTEDNEYYIVGKDELDNVIYTIYIDADIGLITRIVINMAITAISDYAFGDLTSLTSLEINAVSLTGIDANAFNNCSSLSVIYFKGADSTITLGNSILSGCSRNASLIFPENYISAYVSNNSTWTDLVSTIDMMEIDDTGTLLYYQKPSGSTITLHSFITSIGDGVFSTGFGGIAQVIIPDSVTSIGANAFANMVNLTMVTIPLSVTSIGLGAFSGCTSLIKLTVPFIGDGNTNGYLGYIFGATTYSGNAVYVPASLINLVLTNNTNYTTIADYALYQLNITSITLTNSIVTIGDYAFAQNTKLKSIYFTQYVQEVGDYAFSGCTALNSITFHVYCNLNTIGSYAFSGCTSLKVLNLNYKVTEIGFGAFASCSALEEIKLNFAGQKLDGTGATHFGYIFGAATYSDNAAYVPSTLYKVTIQANYSVASIDIADYAFYNCSHIVYLNISAATIGAEGVHAYDGCTAAITR